jgi:hypothetical protein
LFVWGQRCLLRIFLIGVSDYKNASINDLFSPYLIPSLKQDMQCKVERELGVNIAQLEDDLFGTDDVLGSNNQASPDTPTGNGHAPSARRIENGANMARLFIEIFQADLTKFPGGKKVSKLISRTNPHWQTAIQTKLIWIT